MPPRDRLPQGDRNQPALDPDIHVTRMVASAVRLYSVLKPSPGPGSWIRGMAYLYKRAQFAQWVTAHVLVWGRLPPGDDILCWVLRGRPRQPEDGWDRR